VVPDAEDTVTIADGHDVYINLASAAANVIHVQGILHIDNNFSLVVGQSMDVWGGVFTTPGSGVTLDKALGTVSLITESGSNLTVNSLTVAENTTASLTLGNPINIDTSLVINANATLNTTPASIIYFTAGLSQTITAPPGSTHYIGTIYKTASGSGEVLTFPAGATIQTGTAWLGGASSSKRLQLRSSTPGTQWNLQAESRILYYLDVQDGYCIKNASDEKCRVTKLTDSGNNTNWEPVPVDTTTTLYPSGAATDYGNAATFTAVVTATDDTPTGGVVSLWEGLFEIAEATLVNGVADFSVENLPALTHPNLTARFEGSTGFNPSITATPVTHTVVPRPDTAVVTLDVGGSAAPFGQPLLLAATVSGLNRPGGTVTFYDATSTLGTAEVLPTGTARLLVDNLAQGAHIFRASYSGDVNNQGSFVSGDVALTVTPPAGNIYVVDRNDDVYDTVSHTCSAAANDCSLREAVYWANLNPGSVILLGPTGRIDVASFGPDDDLNAVGDLDITASMTIKGNGWQPADMTGTGSNWVNCNSYSRCFDIHSGANVVMTGFVIVNGKAEMGFDDATDPTNGESGGAIRHRGANLMLSNMGFKFNSAGRGGNSLSATVKTPANGGHGGAVYAEAPLQVYASRFESNFAGGGGGGFSDNGSGPGGDAGNGGQGGGIYCSGFSGCASLLVLDSTFSSNQSGSGGQGGNSLSDVGGDGGMGGHGAALAGDGVFQIEASSFEYNQAGSGGVFGTPVNSGGFYADGGSGGGIYFAGGVLQIEDSLFKTQYAGDGSSNGHGNGGNGGAIYADGGNWINLNIYRTTFKTNTSGNGNPSGLGGSSGHGGALYLYGDVELDLANCSFYSNNAGYPQDSVWGGNGGAIYFDQLTAEGHIGYSTFANNAAGLNWSDESYHGTGGHFYFNDMDPGATQTIRASILTDGRASSTIGFSGSQCAGTAYGFVSGGYNLLGDLTGCNLTPLASDHVLTGFEGSGVAGVEDMGGPVPVAYLYYESPAMNLVPYGMADCGTNMITDARGMSRQQGSACEAGAYEQGMPVGFTILSGNNQRKTTGTDFDALASRLLDEIGGPLHSIPVTATCPAEGASCYFNSNPSSLIQTYNSYNSSTMMGHTYFSPKANPTSGSYTVLITAYPATTTFNLTNTLGTTLALTLDPNPSNYGQSVAMIATITPSAATGTVYFYESAALLGSADLSGGTATFNTSTLTVGTHVVTATYYGGGIYNGSTSSSRSQEVVNQVTSTLTLASGLNPSTYGQAVTLTATISPVEATGAISFFDGAASLGSAVLSGGTAVLTISTLTVGTHVVTSTYAGGGVYLPSTADAVLQTVNKGVVMVTLTGPASSTVFGQAAAFHVTVSAALGTPTGTVELYEGGTLLGSSALADGTATIQVSSLNAGLHSLSASYTGSATYATATSGLATHTVGKADTLTSLENVPAEARVGEAVTIEVTVTAVAPGAGSPDGTVTVSADDGASCVTTVAAGACQLTFASAGSKTITATYHATANFKGSISLTEMIAVALRVKIYMPLIILP